MHTQRRDTRLHHSCWALCDSLSVLCTDCLNLFLASIEITSVWLWSVEDENTCTSISYVTVNIQYLRPK